jgi:hypothetical protein
VRGIQAEVGSERQKSLARATMNVPRPPGKHGTAADAMVARTEQLSIGVVIPPERTEDGFRSFFVRGPNQVLIEFVEAGPITVP